MKRFLCWVFVLCAGTICMAQERIKERAEVEQAISRLLFSDVHRFSLPDSAMYYSFFFKVYVSVNNGKQDAFALPGTSIAAKICITYEKLEHLDYTVFMNKRNKAIFIIPVIFDVIDSKRKAFKFKHNMDISDSMMELYARDPHIDEYIYFRPFTIQINKKADGW